MRPLPTIERYRASDYYQRRKIKAQYLKRGLPPPDIRTGRASPLKGQKRPNLQARQGPQPQRWKTGPDRLKHDKFCVWHQHRCQARYRNEPYELTFEDFEQAWGVLWHQRGREKNNYCLIRQDRTRPWTKTNIQVVLHGEHAQRNLRGLG